MTLGLFDPAFLGGLAAAPALLLDSYPGAAAAYSLRQLRTGVTNVVRVRRSSDNTESDFTATQISDGTLAAWVGAGNNGFVRTWYDQSGNNLHLQQGTNSRQPIIVSTGSLVVSGTRPGITFDGSNHFLTNAAFTQAGLTAFAAFVVGLATVDFGYDPTTNGGGAFIRAMPAPSFNYDGRYDLTESYLSTGGATAASYFLGSALIDGSSLNLFVNSSAFANRTFSSPYDGRSGLTVGTIASLSLYSSGTFQELIAYKISRSSSRAAIEANINAHYSIF
jgi:hypothetical protein